MSSGGVDSGSDNRGHFNVFSLYFVQGARCRSCRDLYVFAIHSVVAHCSRHLVEHLALEAAPCSNRAKITLNRAYCILGSPFGHHCGVRYFILVAFKPK